METEVDKYLAELRRYRELLRGVSDERACKVLMELIAEAETRLRAAEQTKRTEIINDKGPKKRASSPGR
jgi:hypothetical protein